MQPTPPAPESLDAAAAAALLGVKQQTLYAYASRGLVRRVGTGKRRRYLREDLERLHTRTRARAGHGAVAAAALSFGEPVLDTRITGIDRRGPLYRGRPAVELALDGARFESVAELLWTGAMPESPTPWPYGMAEARFRGEPCRSLDELWRRFPELPPLGPAAGAEAEMQQGRRLILSLAELLVEAKTSTARAAPRRIAELLADSARAPRQDAIEALDLLLVLLADHELNASSFAARVAASTGASLAASILAALCTLSGPRHGGACERVEALLDEAFTLARPRDIVERRLRRGDSVPGFGHPLYPDGDPRAVALLGRAEALARPGAARRLAPCFEIAEQMTKQGLPPTVDFGLVVLTRALGMRSGMAALLFALGRSAGWVAHVLEQRGSDAVLRPRARYLDP